MSRFAAALLVLTLLPVRAAGQVRDSIPPVLPSARPPVPPIRLWHLGAALAGVAVVSLVDDDVREWTVDHRTGGLRDVATTWEYYGHAATPASIAVGTMIGGAVIRQPEVTRTGARLATSFLVGAAITRAAKRGIGRARPSAGEDQYSFDSWSDQSAFPSGHTTNAFLLTTTLADAIDEPWIDAGLYALAIGTGASRVINDRHWLSDVVGGALLGTTIAKVVDGRWRIFNLAPPTFLVGPTGTGLRWQLDLPALRSAPARAD
jgi:membrane-associated phospholipid phosphatase